MAKKVTKKSVARKKVAKKSAVKKPAVKKSAAKKAAPRQRAVATKAPAPGVTDAQIRARAFEIYRSGRNPGDPDADWYQAERELGVSVSP